MIGPPFEFFFNDKVYKLIFLNLLLSVVYSVRIWSFKKTPLRKLYWLLVPLGFCVLIFLIEVFAAYFTKTAWDSLMYLVYIWIFCFIIGGVIAFLKMKGYRWLVISVMLLGFWIVNFLLFLAIFTIGHDSL